MSNNDVQFSAVSDDDDEDEDADEGEDGPDSAPVAGEGLEEGGAADVGAEPASDTDSDDADDDGVPEPRECMVCEHACTCVSADDKAIAGGDNDGVDDDDDDDGLSGIENVGAANRSRRVFRDAAPAPRVPDDAAIHDRVKAALKARNKPRAPRNKPKKDKAGKGW